jgi:hypothetical protein
VKAFADALRNIGGALVVMATVVGVSLAGAAVFFAVGMWS